jgi:hypothetical protein
MPTVITPNHSSIGKTVHYVNPANRHLAAIILDVHPDGSVDLVTFKPVKYPVAVKQDSVTRAKLTWHWIERDAE